MTNELRVRYVPVNCTDIHINILGKVKVVEKKKILKANAGAMCQLINSVATTTKGYIFYEKSILVDIFTYRSPLVSESIVFSCSTKLPCCAQYAALNTLTP